MKPNKHLLAIEAGQVTKTNVIGLRKAISADDRRRAGYSVSVVAPKLQGLELAATLDALVKHEPLVRGELHATGVRLLCSRRYAKRWNDFERSVIATLHGFRLVRFDAVSFDGNNSIAPVYRALGETGSFLFRTVAWQAGGDGPRVVT